MKRSSPYTCDYCGADKGATNHWRLRDKTTDHFILMDWDDDLADQDGVEHICSESCASKALSRWMGQGR